MGVLIWLLEGVGAVENELKVVVIAEEAESEKGD